MSRGRVRGCDNEKNEEDITSKMYLTDNINNKRLSNNQDRWMRRVADDLVNPQTYSKRQGRVSSSVSVGDLILLHWTEQ